MTNVQDLKVLAQFFRSKDIVSVVKSLRLLGYDLRVNETNRTIPLGFFRLCYPFTLPSEARGSVTWKEKGKHKTADVVI